MAESDLIKLRKELSFTKLQLNAIYEFSSAILPTSDVDDILRFFFSILMGPLGLTRAFFFNKKKILFYKKGFPLTANERQLLTKHLKNTTPPFTCANVQSLPDSRLPIKELLIQKQIFLLVNISETRSDTVILGLGRKFNHEEFSIEDQEYVFFLSRFAMIALNNVHFVMQMLEKKRMEHEMAIAREIQRSLLPQSIPSFDGFDIAVIYEPIREVGGDYYDFLQRKKNLLAVALADVEGKSLSSALVAASSQAIFHTMNELYLFQPAKFIQKANALVSSLTRGQRFITLLWMLLDQENMTLTYVNAGHYSPYLVSDAGITKLDRGGILLGFDPEVAYEQETVPLAPGNIIVAFTDGVLEVQDPEGREFGADAIASHVRSNRHLAAADIAAKLYKRILTFSQKEKFKDDFTVLLIKAK